MEDKIKQLFNFLSELGENHFPKFDVIKIEDGKENEGFRVYHQNCHCVDVYYRFDEELDEGNGGWEYTYQSDLFDGFKPISVDDFCKMINVR